MRLVRVLAPVSIAYGRTPARGLVLLTALVMAPAAVDAGPPPISFADIVERVAPAVVNISTTKEIARGQMPDLPFPEPPPGSPFEDFFREFFDQDRPPQEMPRRQASWARASWSIPAASWSPTTT